MIYRTQKNVPDVYINQSRDFQLLGRLLDVVVNDAKFYTEGILHTINVKECPSNLLPLLATKIGFITKYELQENQLRGILQAFPWLIRYKGSKRAIYQSIFLFLRLEGVNPGFKVEVINKDTSVPPDDSYTITISFYSKPLNTVILDSIFEYILPPGYQVIYQFVSESKSDNKPTAVEKDGIQGFIVGDGINAQLRSSGFDGTYVKQDPIIDNLISGADTGYVSYNGEDSTGPIDEINDFPSQNNP